MKPVFCVILTVYLFSGFSVNASEDILTLKTLDADRYVYHCGIKGRGVSSVLESDSLSHLSSDWQLLTEEQLEQVLSHRGEILNGNIWGPGIYVGAKMVAAKFKDPDSPVCYEFFLPSKMLYLDLAAYECEFIETDSIEKSMLNSDKCNERECLDLTIEEPVDFSCVQPMPLLRNSRTFQFSREIRENYWRGLYQINARVSGISVTKYDVFYILRDNYSQSIYYRRIDEKLVTNG